MNRSIKPCPFCGKQLNLEDPDTLHPSGIYWRYEHEAGTRVFVSFPHHREYDNPCYSINCVKSSGGCGAEIHADSKDEAIAAWNRRFPNP